MELPGQFHCQFRSESSLETEAIGSELARSLTPGSCVALEGDLGAGKTQFVRGLVRSLGGDARQVSSPTYVLLHVYRCRDLSVFHLDAYRVSGPEEFEQIGFGELLEQRGIVIVEWASRIRDLLPPETIWVEIVSESPNARALTIGRGA